MTTKIWKRTAVSALAAVMAVSMAPCRSEAKETSGEKTELTFWLTNEGKTMKRYSMNLKSVQARTWELTSR